MTHFDIETHRQEIIALLREKQDEQAQDRIKQIAREEFIGQDNLPGLYEFFSPIYDELFYEIMTEKIKVATSTKLLIERLALPLDRLDETRRQKILKKVG